MGRASDIWSLGCIVYQIAYGYTPFGKIHNMAQKVYAITNPNVTIDFPPCTNSDVLDIMKRCLVRDPEKRITMRELLAHPYVHQEVRPPPLAGPCV